MTDTAERDHYRRLPYQGRAHFPSHVDVLATVPTLFGLSTPPPTRCRVLEIGCGDGTNLISMAHQLPESEFVGFDLVDTHIESGQQMLADLRLDNVTLYQQDLRDITVDLGDFDYIIAHGVFSWIPEDARQALLNLLRGHLRPEGIGYISYNCYPGWHFDEHLRGMMRYHTQGLPSAKEEVEQARAILQFVQSATLDQSTIRYHYLAEMNEKMSSFSDDYIYHEYLEPTNHPVYFTEFMRIAQKAGLQYVGETSFPSMLALQYPESVQKTLHELGRNLIEYEQYRDFVCNRRFRNTLLTHKEVKLNRSVTLQPITRFQIGFQLQPMIEDPTPGESTPLHFGTENSPESSVTVSYPHHKSALRLLASRWPSAVPFEEIATYVQAKTGLKGDAALYTSLADMFMRLYSRGLCDFHTFQAPMTNIVESHPMVSKLVRYQAFHHRILSTQRNEMFAINPVEREIVTRLNGKRDRNALIEEVAAVITTENAPELGDMTREAVAAQLIDKLLVRLAWKGLLLPNPDASASD